MSKIYKTTIVESLPETGEKDIIYLVMEDGAFVAYIYIGSTFLRVGEEYEVATSSSDGLMAAGDKAKLDVLGSISYQDMETVSVASGSAVLARTIPIRSGYWILITMVYFPGNSGGGYRYTYIADELGGSRIDRMAEDNGANVGDTTYNSRIVTVVTGAHNYYLYAQQNSGSTLSCRVQHKAICINTLS